MSDIKHRSGRTTGGTPNRGLDELLPVVYDELRRIAAYQLRKERSGHTLNPTALVHEAYIRLAGKKDLDWKGSNQFYAVLSRAMRHILVNYARDRRRHKRKGRMAQVPLDEALGVLYDERPEDLVTLDEALKRLEELDERCCRIVECRFFGGLTIKETADALSVSPMTVTRDWQFARVWIKREMNR